MSVEIAPVPSVHVLAPAQFGGLETVVHSLATGLRDAGASVTIVPILAPGEARSSPVCQTLFAAGIDVVPTEVAARDYARERRAVRAVIESRRAKLLHTHGYRPDVVDSGVAKRLGIPRVTTVHGFTGGGGWKNRFYERMQRRAFRSFDGVFAVSEKLRRELVETGIPENRVHTVRNAWQPSSPPMTQENARGSLDLGADEPLVGWVGRFTHEKGPDVFVEAAALVQSPSVRFSMIGSGPLEPDCHALAETLGVTSRIRWHGTIPGAGAILTAFDILVITSWTEGTPMLLLEAMSAGVPVVTTNVGGIPDVVSVSEARLCPPGEPVALASAIDELLADSTLRSRLAGAGKKRVVSDNAIGPWVHRHLEIYNSLVEA